MTALSMPLPYTWGHAYHINDSGQVIGNISAPHEITHAALWNDGHVTDMGTSPGFSNSIAQGLNNQGEAVGRCFNDYSPIQIFLRNHVGSDNALGSYLNRNTDRAFVCRKGKMQDLNKLIPRNDDWILENAHGINDRGQIVGQGLHHGQERGFLLTPVR